MVVETRKILDPEIKVHATCVRVPVFVGHSEAVNIECEQARDRGRGARRVAGRAGRACDRYAGMTPAMPRRWTAPVRTTSSSAASDAIATVQNGLSFWCVSDNLRKGAALNAVQIAEAMVARKLLAKAA